jgi:hypothetical protein
MNLACVKSRANPSGIAISIVSRLYTYNIDVVQGPGECDLSFAGFFRTLVHRQILRRQCGEGIARLFRMRGPRLYVIGQHGRRSTLPSKHAGDAPRSEAEPGGVMVC